MLEIGVFHNGATDLPTKEVDYDGGVIVNDGTLADTHQAAQRTIVNQVRQGILADKLGFDYFFLTEHHFQPEGAELSPNPLLSQTAIAARTKRIRLAQAANIITWWHPLRIAEQAAMLDVLSGGRLDFGIGRGYQPRENETFGWPFGSTIQDQERNRAYYEEAYDAIIDAWTHDSFSHHGEFLSLPPSYTRWGHKQTHAYFSQPGMGRVAPPSSRLSDARVVFGDRQYDTMDGAQPSRPIWEPVASDAFAGLSPGRAAERGNGIAVAQSPAALALPVRVGSLRFEGHFADAEAGAEPSAFAAFESCGTAEPTSVCTRTGYDSADPRPTALDAGASFNVRAGARRVNVDVSGSVAHLGRPKMEAVTYVPWAPDTETADALTKAAVLNGESPMYYPNLADVTRRQIDASVDVPITRLVSVGLQYNAQHYVGSYGQSLLPNVDARKDSYLGNITYQMPHSNSAITFSARQFRYQDNFVPALNLTQTREDVNFTVKF